MVFEGGGPKIGVNERTSVRMRDYGILIKERRHGLRLWLRKLTVVLIIGRLVTATTEKGDLVHPVSSVHCSNYPIAAINH